METLLGWALGILSTLITAAVSAYAKHKVNKAQKERDQAIENAKKIEQEKLDHAIDIKIEPVYQELEDLRRYVRENAELEASQMKLIIASYRFRLIQLCQGLLRQGYITVGQMEQLDEFYKLYTGLGGNGQAKLYYERVIKQLEVISEDD